MDPLIYFAGAIVGVIIIVIGLLLTITDLGGSITTALRRRWSRLRKTAASKKEPVASAFNFQCLRDDVGELRRQQNVLIERLSTVQKVVGQMQSEMDYFKQRLGSQNQHDRTSKSENRRSEDTSRTHRANNRTYEHNSNYYSKSSNQGKVYEAYSDMTELYNASRRDQASRARFREKYKPFFINVTNDVNRRRNQSVPPEFRKETDGGYLAVSRDSAEAIVFPNFTLVIVDAVYGPGALGEVFDCPNFDGRFSYPDIRVLQPAVFKLQGGDSWQPITKGVLELGQAQDA